LNEYVSVVDFYDQLPDTGIMLALVHKLGIAITDLNYSEHAFQAWKHIVLNEEV